MMYVGGDQMVVKMDMELIMGDLEVNELVFV